MKRLCVSAGLVALGASVCHAQYAPGLTPLETTKPWSLSATFRGFYDDNYLTLPKSIPVVTPGGVQYTNGARGSFGVEASPAVSFNHSTSDTLFTASYVYDLRYYEDLNGTTDQSHQFNVKLDHAISERYRFSVSDSFVVAQEPEVLTPYVVSSPFRIPGNNVANTAGLDMTAEMTKVLDLHANYANTLYAFQQNAGDEVIPNAYPSYSAALDRIDQVALVDLRWKARPDTTGVFGYQFEHVGFTSPEDIIFSPSGPAGSPAALDGPGHYPASSRDTDSHFVYAGFDHSFTPLLNFSLRGGAEFVDYYNLDSGEVSPYFDASFTYQYLPQSTVQLGVKEIHNATDVVGTTGTTPVTDEQSTAIYASLTHRFTSKFSLGVLGQAQLSTFDGGGPDYNGQDENFYILNVNFAYNFTPWLMAETGYSYNKLNSAIANRSYTRNQTYIGFRATY